MFQSDFFPDRETSRTVPLAFAIGKKIARRLADGCHLTRPNIAEFFAAQTGVYDWGNAWTIDDYNSAVEIGGLLWLRESSRIDLGTGFHEAGARFDWLEAASPPRPVRSESQVELQQFSTPPILAWLMAKAACLASRDHVLEPSAGNGALALWGDVRDCSLTLNEIDPARRDVLAHLFSRARLTAHDGELIAELANGPRSSLNPSVILMNPPFARSRERGVDGRTAMRHLRSALRVSAVGGRIVAILPDGFAATAFVEDQEHASLLLNVRLSGAFSRSGTGIAVRMVVIEKAARQDASTITGEFADLTELNSCIASLPDRAPLQVNIHRLPIRSMATSVSGAAACKPVAPFVTKAAQRSAAVALNYQALDEPAPVPEQAGIYLPYRPSRVIMEDAPIHPTPLVESVAMGSVAAPVPKARPLLPTNWQSDKLLSAAQCETLIYACEAFTRDLSGQFRPTRHGTTVELAEDGYSYRQGFFLGDGTGAGKGRQIAGVIMDRWLSGERRHIWITKNEALLEDARRDWEALGGLPLDIQPLSRWKLGRPVTMPEGILFVTYPTLRSGRAEDTRLAQILAWAAENFEGVIAFDEAHAMANALGSSSNRGKTKGSEQGMAGLRLQNHLPRARVLYASATGATDITNLGYTVRLGLWGPETAFPTHEAFMTEIRAGGVCGDGTCRPRSQGTGALPCPRIVFRGGRIRNPRAPTHRCAGEDLRCLCRCLGDHPSQSRRSARSHKGGRRGQRRYAQSQCQGCGALDVRRHKAAFLRASSAFDETSESDPGNGRGAER